MRRQGTPPGPPGKFPQWGLPLWYIVITIILIAVWQSTLTQLTVKEIFYSEFKQRLARWRGVQRIDGATGKEGSSVAGARRRARAAGMTCTQRPVGKQKRPRDTGGTFNAVHRTKSRTLPVAAAHARAPEST